MSDGFGFGGNTYAVSGQVAVTATAAEIPLPNEDATLPGTASLQVSAPAAADCFVGPAGVTTATGFRIPQNTTRTFTTRQQLFVIGTSGTATYFYEWN